MLQSFTVNITVATTPYGTLCRPKDKFKLIYTTSRGTPPNVQQRLHSGRELRSTDGNTKLRVERHCELVLSRRSRSTWRPVWRTRTRRRPTDTGCYAVVESINVLLYTRRAGKPHVLWRTQGNNLWATLMGHARRFHKYVPKTYLCVNGGRLELHAVGEDVEKAGKQEVDRLLWSAPRNK